MTYTYVVLEVSESTYDEISNRLREAGYDHVFMERHCDNSIINVIDMTHIAITIQKEVTR